MIAKFAKRKPETDMIVKEPHALPIFIALTYHKHKKVQFMFFFPLNVTIFLNVVLQIYKQQTNSVCRVTLFFAFVNVIFFFGGFKIKKKKI